MDKSNHIPWELLNGSTVIESISADWIELLNNKSVKEATYQSFLMRHAGFFFPHFLMHDEIILSGIWLGADHEIDFIMAHSERSYGFVYTFIEIETPHKSAFNKNGDPSTRLNHAIQQIQNWKSWMEKNNDQVQRLFPSKRSLITGVNHFKYMVIMGRRTDANNEKRNLWANNCGVEIRSFDWFTDNLLKRQFNSFNGYTADLIPLTPEEDNQFSNPFAMAFTDAQWRQIVDSPNLRHSHMVSHNFDLLTKSRVINTQRQDTFFKYLDELPNGPHAPSESAYLRIGRRK